MFLPAAVISAMIGYVEEVAQRVVLIKNLRGWKDTDRFTKFLKLRKSRFQKQPPLNILH